MIIDAFCVQALSQQIQNKLETGSIDTKDWINICQATSKANPHLYI